MMGRRQLRFPRVVLATIAGMLWVAGVATASEAGPAPDCCVGRPAPAADCRCCPPAGATPRPEAAPERATAPAPLGVRGADDPASSCQCRPGQQAPTDQRRESRDPEGRDHPARGGSAAPAPEARPAAVSASRHRADIDPSSSPLYLRTARLRF